jgi:VNT family MFS transporter (synaptic vesicle glycoprotein 2)
MSIYFAQNSLTTIILSSFFVSLGSIGINVILAVVVDLFPTTLRTMTVSLTMMTGRSGAMMGNLIFPTLLQLGCAPPFFTVGAVIIGKIAKASVDGILNLLFDFRLCLLVVSVAEH